MDSKRGGLIVAVLAGLGFVCFINRESQNRVMKAPQRISQAIRHEDYVQHILTNFLLMQIDLAKNQIENPHYNFFPFEEGKQGREGNLKAVVKLNTAMLKQLGMDISNPVIGKTALYPSKYYFGEIKYGPNKGLEYNLDEDEMPTSGPLNHIHELSGSALKNDAVRAVRYARLHPDESLEDLERRWEDAELRGNTKDFKELTTLEDYAYLLYLQQNTFHNIIFLKRNRRTRPFDYQTVLKWVKELVITKTYQGVAMENLLRRKFNFYLPHRMPRVSGSAGQNFQPHRLRVYNVTDDSDKKGVDLVIAENTLTEVKGKKTPFENIVAVIQVKPKSWTGGKNLKAFKDKMKKWNIEGKTSFKKLSVIDDAGEIWTKSPKNKVKPYIFFYEGGEFSKKESTDRLENEVITLNQDKFIY